MKKLSVTPNLQEQIDEWKELGIVDDEFDFSEREEGEIQASAN